MKKPQKVRLCLRGHWFLFAFVSGVESKEIMFSGEGNARKFTRDEAAGVLRRVRTWGSRGYYGLEVLPA